MKLTRKNLTEMIKEVIREDDEWWNKLEPDEQAAYIKAHPKSQKAKDAKEKDEPKEKNPGWAKYDKNPFAPESPEHAGWEKKHGKGKDDFDPEKPDDEPEGDVGGPSYANVPKGAKSSAEAKTMKAKDDYEEAWEHHLQTQGSLETKDWSTPEEKKEMMDMYKTDKKQLVKAKANFAKSLAKSDPKFAKISKHKEEMEEYSRQTQGSVELGDYEEAGLDSMEELRNLAAEDEANMKKAQSQYDRAIKSAMGDSEVSDPHDEPGQRSSSDFLGKGTKNIMNNMHKMVKALDNKPKEKKKLYGKVKKMFGFK
jgi:hypothetical protein